MSNFQFLFIPRSSLNCNFQYLLALMSSLSTLDMPDSNPPIGNEIDECCDCFMELLQKGEQSSKMLCLAVAMKSFFYHGLEMSYT